MKRDWGAARAKVDDEGCCRVCGGTWNIEAAHIIPRSRITSGGEDARNIVPLDRMCHVAYDEGTLDLLPHLTLDEQAYAAELVGLAEAYQRITNERMAA